MSPIEEIDPTKPSGAGEAAAAAYAAALARTTNGSPVEAATAGGGGQALPDAVVLVGGRQADRAAEMRKQAQAMRLEAQKARVDGQKQTETGEKVKAEATSQTAVGWQKKEQARLLDVQAKAQTQAADVAEAAVNATDVLRS